MIELTQTVKLFSDSDKVGEQFVNIDTADNWLCITHDGACISLSIENWLKLNSLVNQALNNIIPNRRPVE